MLFINIITCLCIGQNSSNKTYGGSITGNGSGRKICNHNITGLESSDKIGNDGMKKDSTVPNRKCDLLSNNKALYKPTSSCNIYRKKEQE